MLELSGLSKRYGKVGALEGLNLALAAGQVYGLLGRNGAGKSTALRIVMGVTRADSGTVSLFGEVIKPGNVRARQKVGYVAQEQLFYDWMTPESLGRFVAAFYPTWDKSRFVELIRQFDVPPRKVRTLSGGTKVKLALALALAHRPRLLVLDEPTAGLDAVARRDFLDIVREQATTGEQTTLFSSHLIDDIEMVAGQVGIIESGRMLYEGSLEDLGSRVRRVVMPAVLGDEQDPVPTAIEALNVRILENRTVGRERCVTLWADSRDAWELSEARFGPGRLRELPLEEIFIALVRSGQADFGPWS